MDRHSTRQRLRWRHVLIVLVLVAIGLTGGLFLVAMTFGRGVRGEFSPDTLETRSQREWLVPLVNVPVYRSRYDTHRYQAVDYLIRKGFWAPRHTASPQWIPAYRWNALWRDGHTRMHYELERWGDEWEAWTEGNPNMAAALWPRLLLMLRAGLAFEAGVVLAAAKSAKTANDIDALFTDVAGAEATRPGNWLSRPTTQP